MQYNRAAELGDRHNADLGRARALIGRRPAGSGGQRRQQPRTNTPQHAAGVGEYGIEVTGLRSRHLDELRRRRFDRVITLCDKVRDVCPEFPDSGQAIHWSVPDPAAPGAGRASLPAFLVLGSTATTTVVIALGLLRRSSRPTIVCGHYPGAPSPPRNARAK